MLTFDTITDARNAIMDFRAENFSAIPEDMRTRFKELSASPSPVDQIVGVGEFIYANRAKVQKPAAALAAGLVSFATVNAWHGLLEDQRGDRIVANLRVDLGEIKTAPAAPDAKAGMVVEDEAQDVPAPPAPAPSPTE